MQILIVEDETRMAALLEKGLRAEGHSVVAACTGVEALEAAQSCMFDVIVLDIMLPRLDGFEVVRRLRERRDQTPILVLTARDAPLDKVKGLGIDVDDSFVSSGAQRTIDGFLMFRPHDGSGTRGMDQSTTRFRA